MTDLKDQYSLAQLFSDSAAIFQKQSTRVPMDSQI